MTRISAKYYIETPDDAGKPFNNKNAFRHVERFKARLLLKAGLGKGGKQMLW